MVFLKGLLNIFFSWFRQEPKPLTTIRLGELPDDLDPCAVYVLGEGAYLWFVVMRCPCGCGENLYMTLLPESNPRWQLTEHTNGTISLQPSIWRKVGCRSHFFLRRGRIEWCINYDAIEDAHQ